MNFCIKLIIIYAALIGSHNSFAQSSLLNYADYQYNEENYSIALKEYLRYYYRVTEEVNPGVLEKISVCFVKKGDFDLAVKFLNFAQNIAIGDERYINLLSIAKSQLFTKQKNFKRAIISLYEIGNISVEEEDLYYFHLALNLILDGSVNDGFVEIKKLSFITGEDDYVLQKLNYNISDTFHNRFSLPELLSYIIPGSGQMILGNYEDGINSFGLNVGLLYILSESIESLSYIDGIISVAPWFIRYYIGGVENTQRQEIAKRENNRIILFNQLLNYLKYRKSKFIIE